MQRLETATQDRDMAALSPIAATTRWFPTALIARRLPPPTVPPALGSRLQQCQVARRLRCSSVVGVAPCITCIASGDISGSERRTIPETIDQIGVGDEVLGK